LAAIVSSMGVFIHKRGRGDALMMLAMR
jgi:hypothetical protein